MKQLLITCLLFISMPSFATSLGWGLYLEQGYADEMAAAIQGMGEEVKGGGLTGSIESSITESDSILLQAGYGVISASDEAEFKVMTIDTQHNRRRRSSSISGSSLFFEGGYDKQFQDSGLGAFVNLGFAKYNLDRSISNCKDCPEEEVKLASSSYVHLGFSYQVSKASRIRLGYQHYFSGDMVNGLKIQWLVP